MSFKTLNKCIICILIIMSTLSTYLYSKTKAVYKQKEEYLNLNKELNEQIINQENIISQQNEIISQQENELIILSNTVDDLSQIINSNNYISEISYLGKFTLSFYSKEQFPGKTAIGTYGQVGITIAADTNIIPLGTQVYIDGYGFRYVQDTGGAIKGNKIDVFVETTEEAIQLGRQENIDIWIVK